MSAAVQRARVLGLGALAVGLLCAVFVPTRAHAQAEGASLAEIFRAGNEAYFEGQWDTATERYEHLVDLGVDDADVWFNLGSSYARGGHHGQAIAAFERALRASPGDTSIGRALDASRAALARRRADREGEAFVDGGPTLGEAIFGAFSPDTLAMAGLFGDALLFACLFGLLFASAERRRVALMIGAAFGALLLVTGGLGASIRSGALDPGAAAVVVRDRALLREGPSDSATERGRAREGERAYLLARDGEWARVELRGGRQGWVAAQDVVLVAPEE